MKKKIIVLFLLLFACLSPMIAFAENDISTENNSTEEDVSAIISAHCLCGRDYYTGEADGHSAFDCTKCGQNMYVCTCNCWCGAATVIDTSGDYGSIIPRICTGCNKPCILCDCRSDREAILFAEQQRKNGEISSLNILRPQNAVIPVVAIVFSALLIALCVIADRKNLFENLLARMPERTEEKEDERTAKEPENKPVENEKEEPGMKKPEVSSGARKKPHVSEANSSSGVYRLYKTVAVMDTNKASRKAFLPQDEADLVFTAEEITAILKATKTAPTQISPFEKVHSDTLGDTLANLMLEGVVLKTDAGFAVENNIGKHISAIADPKTSISFDTVFSGKYTLCSNGAEWYAVNGKKEIQIRIFDDISALCDWISLVFDSSDKDKTIPSSDILFDYGEFSLFALIQILGLKDSFRKEDLMRPDVCAKIKNSLYSEGFFSTAKTFEDLSIEEEIDRTIDEMNKKGLVFENNEEYTCSKTLNAVLGNDGINECIHITKKGSAEFEILFAIRENGATAIYDTKSDIRILSAKNIPWKQYIG